MRVTDGAVYHDQFAQNMLKSAEKKDMTSLLMTLLIVARMLKKQTNNIAHSFSKHFEPVIA